MSIIVKVGTIPGTVKEVALNGDRTVSAALEVAGVSSSGYSITVNGAPAEPNRVLSDGDRVLLTRGAKGNQS